MKNETSPNNSANRKLNIVVIGGTGLIGTKVVNLLRLQGHEVTPAAPSLGINAVTGEGLSKALAGKQVVVDVSNSPSFEDKPVMEFFDRSTRHLLEAAAAAGVEHYVALSVVGTERLLASGYFRAKMAQETLIKESRLPYTLVRATQFFEFIGSIAQSATSGDTVRIAPALMQPIYSGDVAEEVARAALSEPLNGTVEVAGPRAIPLPEVVRLFLEAHHDSRPVIADETAGYFGTPVNDQSLTPGENPRLGATTLEEWLKRTAGGRER
jgi:uncharacterized protein YbjT (DUF2867 family)